jgi:uncharacterized membrane-anchored protein
MVMLSEGAGIALAAALISGVTAVLVAFMAQSTLRSQHRASAERQEVIEKITPTNGYDTLGDAIEALEETLIRIDARLRDGDDRFGRIEVLLDQRGKIIGSLESKAAETLYLVGENHAEVKKYIEAWTPLSERAVDEWGVDGKKRRKK